MNFIWGYIKLFQGYFGVLSHPYSVLVLVVDGLVSRNCHAPISVHGPVYVQSVLECIGRWCFDYMLWQCIPTVDHSHAEE